MPRSAMVYNNNVIAGTLVNAEDGSYVFRYDDAYYADTTCSAVSLSLPKTQQEYFASDLFSFFYGLLQEGSNKQIQCKLLGIDDDDHFGLLLATAASETIGAITVREN